MFSRRRLIMTVFGTALVALVAGRASAQEVVVTGPPPELRAHLGAFVKAVNGTPEQWEAMAKATFTPEFLKRETPVERKALYTRLRTKFGTVQVERVERNGPEAPLQVFIKGSTTSGIIWITLDDASMFAGIKPEGSQSLEAYRRH
jgi:hypothetical protein